MNIGRLSLDVLGRRVHLEFRDAGLLEATKAAWSRCVSSIPDNGSGHAVWGEGPLSLAADDTDRLCLGDGEGLCARLTAEGIVHGSGRLLMLHAAGLAAGDGAVVALVGASGAGKTTAASRLCETHFGYVTDEVVAVDAEGSVIAFPRPLYAHGPEPGRHGKRQRSPDELQLQHCGHALTLTDVVLLQRSDQDTPPRLENVPLVEGLLEVIPQTSSLPALDRPLQFLCGLVSRYGGIRRLVYSDIDAAEGLLITDLEASRRFDDVWADPGGRPEPEDSAAWGLMDGRVRRRPYVDAVTSGDEALVLVHDLPVRLSGIGVTIWLAAAQGPTLGEMIDRVVDVHGPHPEAGDLVRSAVQILVDANVLGYERPHPLTVQPSDAALASLPRAPRAGTGR